MKKYILIFCLVTFSNLMYGQADYGFTLKGGVNFPVGDFAKFYNAGIGGFGGFFYNLRPSTRFSFSIGYNSWSLDLDALNEELKNSGNTGSYDVEAPVKTIPIFINVKLFWRDNPNFYPYVVLEGGVYKITRELYGRYISENGESIKVTPRNESYTDGSFNFGIGFEYPINDVITLDVSSRYHMVLQENVYSMGDAGYQSEFSTSNFISLFAGINVFFE